jgi:hypothetical protein
VVSHPRFAIALGIAIVIALGVLTELTIQGGHVVEWLAALQTLSSLILILITAVYVFLTYRMLQVQQKPVEAMRLEREFAGVQELGGRLLAFGLVIDALSKPYPLAIGIRPVAQELMTSAAYAIDVATVSAAASTLQEATATAAIEAAQQLDAADFRASGVMTVDAGAARRAARAVLAAEAPSASVSSVTVSGAEVTVVADEAVELPLDFLPTRRVWLEARASARLSGGYERPNSRSPIVPVVDSSGTL